MLVDSDVTLEQGSVGNYDIDLIFRRTSNSEVILALDVHGVHHFFINDVETLNEFSRSKAAILSEKCNYSYIHFKDISTNPSERQDYLVKFLRTKIPWISLRPLLLNP
eukprot:TRINITY_DN7550_c0_g1_i1.p1 TRINITY_DN7550_c0_g1~~TRINITY_DN7550_c0_g1_i1.p1  ORF type:complete len:108 (-),score=11.10 TRINITY_DN7550_c0_g1_i1:50-373(-)